MIKGISLLLTSQAVLFSTLQDPVICCASKTDLYSREAVLKRNYIYFYTLNVNKASPLRYILYPPKLL